MAKYLYMDGVDDRIQVPSMAMTEIVLEFSALQKTGVFQRYWSFPFGAQFVQRRSDGLDEFTGGHNFVSVDGANVSNLTAFVPRDKKLNMRSVLTTVQTQVTHIFNNNGTSNFMEGYIYSIKFFNGTTLQAHYDMSTGTVLDQSGNGRHATLVGGTWMDDGGGEEPPEPNHYNLALSDAVSFTDLLAKRYSGFKSLSDGVALTDSHTSEFTPGQQTETIIQNLSPDEIVSLSNLNGPVTAIQDDPSSPDANFLTISSNANPTSALVGFPTPTHRLKNGANLQTLRVFVRKNATGGNNPTVTLSLLENGTVLASSQAFTLSTDTALYTFSFDASLLIDKSGENVECRIDGSLSSGNATNRRTVEIGAVQWVATTERIVGDNNEYAVTLTDSVSFLEVFTKRYTGTKSDNIPLAETIRKNANKSREDTVGTNDTASKRLSVAVVDSINTTENEHEHTSKRLNDSVMSSDSLSSRKQHFKVFTDNILSSESFNASREGQQSITLNDAVTLLDAISKAVRRNRSDSVQTTETERGTTTKQLVDSITQSDSLILTGGKSVLLTDSISVSDSIRKVVQKLRTESVSLGEILQKQSAQSIRLFDVALTEDQSSTFNPNTPNLIGVIHLDGQRELSVHLLGKRDIDVHLTGKRELDIRLKGSV